MLENVEYSSSHEQLRATSGRFGQVVDIQHAGRGFAFVQFSNKNEAEHALATMGGTQFLGRSLRTRRYQVPAEFNEKRRRWHKKAMRGKVPVSRVVAFVEVIATGVVEEAGKGFILVCTRAASSALHPRWKKSVELRENGRFCKGGGGTWSIQWDGLNPDRGHLTIVWNSWGSAWVVETRDGGQSFAGRDV